MNRVFALSSTLALALLGASCGVSDQPVEANEEFPLKIEEPLSSAPVFLLHKIAHDHSEGVSVLDMNQDGRLDVLDAGEAADLDEGHRD